MKHQQGRFSMALNNPTPADIAARNVAYGKAMNPFYHQKRFEIQLHTGDTRRNLYFPRWEVVDLVLKTIKPDDRHGPDRVIVSDNRDTCIRVLEWERCWYGYRTRVRRGAAVGVEPRGWDTETVPLSSNNKVEK
jgi:hypothetical protein